MNMKATLLMMAAALALAACGFTRPAQPTLTPIPPGDSSLGLPTAEPGAPVDSGVGGPVEGYTEFHVSEGYSFDYPLGWFVNGKNPQQIVVTSYRPDDVAAAAQPGQTQITFETAEAASLDDLMASPRVSGELSGENFVEKSRQQITLPGGEPALRIDAGMGDVVYYFAVVGGKGVILSAYGDVPVIDTVGRSLRAKPADQPSTNSVEGPYTPEIETVRSVLTSFDPNTGLLTFEDGFQAVLSPDTPITIEDITLDGATGSTGDLQPGSVVQVSYKYGDAQPVKALNVSVQIDLRGLLPEQPYEWRDTFLNSVDAGAKTFLLDPHGFVVRWDENTRFILDDDTVNGTPAGPEILVPGREVHAMVLQGSGEPPLAMVVFVTP